MIKRNTLYENNETRIIIIGLVSEILSKRCNLSFLTRITMNPKNFAFVFWCKKDITTLLIKVKQHCFFCYYISKCFGILSFIGFRFSMAEKNIWKFCKLWVFKLVLLMDTIFEITITSLVICWAGLLFFLICLIHEQK